MTNTPQMVQEGHIYPQPVSGYVPAVIDVEQLIMRECYPIKMKSTTLIHPVELMAKCVCLGRGPGFRIRDVETVLYQLAMT
jgi:hypothetical protein